MTNTMQLCGLDFIEFSSAEPQHLESLFFAFGFSKVGENLQKRVDYFKQNDIHLFLNRNDKSVASTFSKKHGPSVSALGLRFINPQNAFDLALKRGAVAANGDLTSNSGEPVLAVQGIGGMLIYFMDPLAAQNSYCSLGFTPHSQAQNVPTKGFLKIDHLTNNVEQGTMQKWADFYKNIFDFEEVRYFDIRGAKTGLTSYALKSPCGSFCIPINEGTENKSQINEYLEEYKGPGIQHLAFLTNNILNSLEQLRSSKIQTLDIDDAYYAEIFEKFPHIKENPEQIRSHNVLIDGDQDGYLLQIFTKNLIGPIFIEIIQRNNHNSFGEGNFGALFRSIERDQMKRGYLPT